MSAAPTSDNDWDRLVSQLPSAWRGRFELLLRRTLARRDRLADQGDSLAVPESVRAQAVGTWRRRHMAGASKSALRRKGYAQLRGDPSYQAIERTLARRYWKRRLPPVATRAEAVAQMTLAEACESYRSAPLQLAGSPLDGFLRECLRDACARVSQSADLLEEVVAAMADRAARDDLSTCARLYEDDPQRPGRLRRREFSLESATSEQEVADLVRSTHLVGGLLDRAYGSHDATIACGSLVATRAAELPELAALEELFRRLVGSRDVVTKALDKTARMQAVPLAQALLGDEVAARLAGALLENPRYARQYQRAVELRLRVRRNVPETPMEAYPLARTMRRRFVVHVGPTNAGKTHSALERLMAAPSGAYLGPLRLLAYEQFDRMNRAGVPCTLLTGEEQVEVPGARHVASTVEMASYERAVDVAVIDEAQMIADPERGHGWTGAILGIPAREVHVCCAPHAEDVVRRLVALCEDDCEVVRHERLVPLRASRASCAIPTGVQPGDALIVFSRRSVHRIAAQVAAAGLRASVIYGALPHDVRHEEARRFDEGETDVVVATDAIGMGMNLPIRRIVFVEQEKFDGQALRMLQPGEVQQIAGRAGRFGRYEEGLFQSTRRGRRIVELYGQEVPGIESIPVGIPRDLALVSDATLGESIRQWAALEQPDPFRRVDVSRELRLLAEAEPWLDEDLRTDTDAKLRELALITMPFDERDRVLKMAWRQMAQATLEGRRAALFVPGAPREGADLSSLEADYHYCDLLYSYERTFGEQERRDLLTMRREQISHAIMDLLAQGAAVG